MLDSPTLDEPGSARRTAPRGPTLDRLSCIDARGARVKIQPADVRGRFQVRKRLLWIALIAIYVSLPWIEVAGRPAVLIDIVHRRFYLFGQTFNAQDFWLAFFLLTGIGFALIVVSALWGRVWCGYACPQTVFLEGVFRRVERLFEGTPAQRKRRAAAGWTTARVLRAVGKYATFGVIAAALAHTLLGYFMPVRDVLRAMTSPPTEHPTAFLFVVLTTGLVYANFAWFREQLCIVVCPYGRLQSVLYDRDTINVGYDRTRGEPRGALGTAGAGDCIDCRRCVAVCPVGIDIRNGTQLECVGCANCIDACDEVMDRIGRPRGLVRYDSQRGFDEGRRQFWRPRVALYAVLLVVGAGVFAFAATRRAPFEADLLRARGPAFTLESDVVTNAFVLHVINKTPDEATFTLRPEPDARLQWTLPITEVRLASLADQHLPVLVRFRAADLPGGGSARLHVASPIGTRTVEVRLVGP